MYSLNEVEQILRNKQLFVRSLAFIGERTFGGLFSKS